MMRPLIIVAIIASLVYCIEALSCLKCEPAKCEKLDRTKCYAREVAKDICNCCDVCAKGPGQKCGGVWNIGGTCASGLICRPNAKNWQLSGICIKLKVVRPTGRPL